MPWAVDSEATLDVTVWSCVVLFVMSVGGVAVVLDSVIGRCGSLFMDGTSSEGGLAWAAACFLGIEFKSKRHS